MERYLKAAGHKHTLFVFISKSQMFRKSMDCSMGLQTLIKADILLVVLIHYTRVNAISGNFY